MEVRPYRIYLCHVEALRSYLNSGQSVGYSRVNPVGVADFFEPGFRANRSYVRANHSAVSEAVSSIIGAGCSYYAEPAVEILYQVELGVQPAVSYASYCNRVG